MINKYDEPLDLKTENPLSIIAKKITSNATVLEIGPARGRLTQYLKNSLNCTIDIVEKDESIGKHATQFARTSFLGVKDGDIEKEFWFNALKNQKYDYIILADVLEHLYNPQEVLKKCRTLLGEKGKLLVSTPNIAHNAILINLYYNSFNYTPMGLLDDTHIRFWGIENIKQLFSNANLFIVAINAVSKTPEETEQVAFFPPGYENILSFFSNRLEGNIYQYVFELQKHNNADTIIPNYEINQSAPSCLYYDYGEGYSEKYKDADIIILNKVVSKHFSLDTKKTIQKLRFDPVEGIACKVAIFDVISDGKIESIYPLNSRNAQREEVDIFYTDDPMYEIQGNFENATFLEIHLKVEQIHFRESMINLQQALFINEKRLADTLEELQTKNAEILGQKQELQSKDAEILGQKQELQSKDAEILGQKQELQSKDAEILGQKQELSKKESQIETLNMELNVIYTSKAWHVIEKYRKIKDFLFLKLYRRREP